MVKIKLEHTTCGFVDLKLSADDDRGFLDVLAEIQRRTLRREREYRPESRQWIFRDNIELRQALHYVREYYACQIIEFVRTGRPLADHNEGDRPVDREARPHGF